MREHLLSNGYLQAFSPDGTSRSSISGEDNDNYSATFRELFCVVASDIARTLEVPLQDLGCLYEDILTTGTLLTRSTRKDGEKKAIIAADVARTPGELESGRVNPILFGKGQLLVLTRRVDKDAASRLQNSGFRFAHLEQVGDGLARSLEVSREDLSTIVKRLQRYCDRKPWSHDSGAYLAAFLLQPSPAISGLDVVVFRETPDRLPMIKLDSDELESWQAKILKHYDGLTLDEYLQRVVQRHGAHTGDDSMWLDKFGGKVSQLAKAVPEPLLHRAVFSAKPLPAVHGSGNSSHDGQRATVYAFCGIKDVNTQTLASSALSAVPLSLFQCEQRVAPGCADHAIFARKTHLEFSALLHADDARTLDGHRSRKWSTFWRFAKASPAASDVTLHPDSSSEKNLVAGAGGHAYAQTQPNSPRPHDVDTAATVAAAAALSPAPAATSHPFGGIMVSQHITVHHDQKDEAQLEMVDMGVRPEAGIADQEQPTLAHRLLRLTREMQARRARQVPDAWR